MRHSNHLGLGEKPNFITYQKNQKPRFYTRGFIRNYIGCLRHFEIQTGFLYEELYIVRNMKSKKLECLGYEGVRLVGHKES